MPIPVSEIVRILPGVLSAGSSPLALNGVILSNFSMEPANQVQEFFSAQAVSDYFGPTSTEYTIAQVYFAGYEGSTIKPQALFVAPYLSANAAAFLGSGSLAGLTLTQLQGFSGTLIISVDGTPFTSSTINLAGATSFTNAATLIAAGFSGGAAPTCAWDAINSRFALTSTTTGTSSTITYCTGTLSTNLKFTQATGAILSQGAVADTPATAMNRVVAQTQNWATFMVTWIIDNTLKGGFSAWAESKNNRYLFVCWDQDTQASVSNSTTNFGYIAKQVPYNNVTLISGDPSTPSFAYALLADAIFLCGAIASINFSRINGRATMAFKSGDASPISLVSCEDQTISEILIANGYNFYGNYAEVNNQFKFLYNGNMIGKWLWIDSYVNQIYLNSQFRLAVINLFTNVNSIPYNNSGYGLIRSAMQDPIAQALLSGVIRTGVTLSNAQIAEINTAAGAPVAGDIQTQGYYLQILDPGATARASRGSPIINFWYTDGESVQQLTIPSINIQ